MIRSLILTGAVALGLSTGAALAAGTAGHVEDTDFSFEGPFGSFDQMQLQRGLQVYTEVCSACHRFYPGQQKLMDTAGRVDQFRKRFRR